MTGPQQRCSDPYMKADLAVAAQRMFNAALRTARASRIAPAQALRVANDFVVRQLGFDWISELGIAAELEELAPAHEPVTITGRASSVAEFMEALLAGELAPLKPMPGLTTAWYGAYTAWCSRSGKRAAPLKRFVYELDHSYSFRTARKGLREAGVRSHPKSVLCFGIEAPRGVLESEWLADQVRSSCELFAAAGLRMN